MLIIFTVPLFTTTVEFVCFFYGAPRNLSKAAHWLTNILHSAISFPSWKKWKKKTTQNKKKARCITGCLFVIYLFCCVTIFLKKKKKETHNSGENAFLGAIFHMYLSLKIIKFSFLFTMKLSVDSCLLFIVNPIIYCIIFIVVANHPSRFFFLFSIFFPFWVARKCHLFVCF